MKLELHDVSLYFPGQSDPVLSHVDFSDDFGSLAIIGSSGGGKSTLLRILGGLLSPTSGEILVDGRKIPQEASALQQYRKEIGFVFQHGGLFRHMTALQNIVTPLIHVHGYTPTAAKKRALDLLEQLGLERDREKRPSQLSGGQRQRVSIARALAAQPNFLLLDEPTSALDPEYTSEVLSTLNHLKKQGVQMILVTHEMGFARYVCEKVAFLHSGTLLEWGESNQVFPSPQTPQLQQFLSKILEWEKA